jgi:hypothetical protein
LQICNMPELRLQHDIVAQIIYFLDKPLYK